MMRNAWMLILSLMVFSSCGTQSPLDILGDTSTIPRNLNLPTSGITAVASQYTATSQALGLTVTAGSLILAPAAGVVTGLSGTLGNYSVIILHNGRLSTRVAGIYTLGNINIGTQVAQGTAIGTQTVGNTLFFSTFLDSTSSCPLAFLSSTAMSTLVGVTTNLCN